MAHAVGGFLLTVARQWMTNIYTVQVSEKINMFRVSYADVTFISA